MKYFTLENVTVENPCSADWDKMAGSGDIRLCHSCQTNVHNISEMPKRRALKVLNQPQEKVCISYITDKNDKIITQTYLGLFKRNLAKIVGTVFAAILSLSPIYALQTSSIKPKKKVLHSKSKKKSAKMRKPKILIGKPTRPPNIGVRILSKSVSPINAENDINNS